MVMSEFLNLLHFTNTNAVFTCTETDNNFILLNIYIQQ